MSDQPCELVVELETENARLRDLLQSAARLLSVCVFDDPADLESLDEIHAVVGRL